MIGIGIRALPARKSLQNFVSPLQTTRSKSFLSKLKPKFSLPSFKLIPQPPGHIVGTVNDAYVPPMADYWHGGYHWSYERLVTISMVPLMMTPFVYGSSIPAVDAVMNCLLLWHCQAGFESCIIDYIPLRVYGIWHKMAMGLLHLGTCISLYGIYIIETEHNGLINLLVSLWSA